MKFVIFALMLALAVGVNSSLLGYYPGAYAGHGYYGGPAAVTAYGSSGPGLYAGIPGISLSQGPYGAHIAAPIAAPIAVDHGLGHGPAGVYVAKTRGAVHTAPLPGHINSATSVNLAPAPGTY